jgi:uncharacterized protein with PIN domain
MKCKMCATELVIKEDVEDNGVIGPGYKELKSYVFHYCPKCGLVYYLLEETR